MTKQTQYERDAPKRIRMVEEALALGDIPKDAIDHAKSVASYAMSGYPNPKADYWDEVFVHTLYSLVFTRTGRRRKEWGYGR